MTPEQLRASILQYAMEGKLVKQDPNDEPASELLKKIENEKAELVKEGKIKKSKKSPVITDDEKPFDIPDSWEWVRLGNVFDITSSKRVMKNEWRESGIPFYRAREIVSINKNRPLKDPIFIDEDTYLKKIKVSGKPNEGDILLTGVGTLGVPYIVSKDKKIYFKDGNIIWLKNFGNLNSKYLSWYVQCPYMLKEINNNRGTTVGTLTIVRSKKLIIPIPPLEEQKRIVAKIEKLMPLVDEYAESYNRLQKIDDEFEDRLKQSVLQYAMEGKLVKQDHSDEPASELIKKIEDEKAELIKDGKIKKSKKLPAITDDEKPFDIPDSWTWVRLIDIGDWGAGATPSRQHPEYYGGDVLWLKTGDLNDGIIKNTSERITKLGVENSSVKINQPGNVLIAMYGATIGKLGIVGKTLVTNQACCGCTPFKGIYNWFLFYYLLSARKRLIDLGSGGAQPNISKTKIEKFLFPLPSLKEQKRIVSKIEKVFEEIEKNKR